MTVALLRGVDSPTGRYDALMVWCLGCEQPDGEGGTHGGLHMLPVTGEGQGRPTWAFSGDLERPTLSPSILTRHEHARRRVDGALVDVGLFVCHSFLVAGVWDFLSDCTHPLAGQKVPMVPLPDWVVRET